MKLGGNLTLGLDALLLVPGRPYNCKRLSLSLSSGGGGVAPSLWHQSSLVASAAAVM